MKTQIKILGENVMYKNIFLATPKNKNGFIEN